MHRTFSQFTLDFDLNLSIQIPVQIIAFCLLKGENILLSKPLKKTDAIRLLYYAESENSVLIFTETTSVLKNKMAAMLLCCIHF